MSSMSRNCSMSCLITSLQYFFGLPLPRLKPSKAISHLQTGASVPLLITCLNHLSLPSRILSSTAATPTLSRIVSFLTLSALVIPHPTQHPHFCHLQLLDVRILNRTTLRAMQHSRPDCNSVEFVFKLGRHLLIAKNSRGELPFQPTRLNTVRDILVNLSIPLNHRPKAPAERRQVFRKELQRVSTAGAKVLREIGEKVKKMEKLGSVDILYEVHEAAEALQKKVDQKSYLFVNSENWEIGTRATVVDTPQEPGSLDDDRNSFLHHRSHSETVINIDSILNSKSWDNRTCNFASNNQAAGLTPQNTVEKPKFRTTHSLPKDNEALKEVEEEEDDKLEVSKTYESASALSLATFTSLLIEFVARLQNVVDSFEELSEKAKFKEAVDLSEASQKVSIWSRLKGFIKFWKREESSLPV